MTVIQRRRRYDGRVLNRDATKLLKRMDPASVGAIITDPPATLNGISEGHTLDSMIEWLEPFAEAVTRSLRQGGACVVMGKSQLLSAWDVAASRAGLRWIADFTILWDTENPAESMSSVARWHTKVGLRQMHNGRREALSNVIACKDIPMRDRECVTQKPVELTNFLVSMLTGVGDLVVDPFCGYGSTLVSAEMCGRRWAGCDIDPEMVKRARQRMGLIHLEDADLKPIYFWRQHQLTLIGGEEEREWA